MIQNVFPFSSIQNERDARDKNNFILFSNGSQ